MTYDISGWLLGLHIHHPSKVKLEQEMLCTASAKITLIGFSLQIYEKQHSFMGVFHVF